MPFSVVLHLFPAAAQAIAQGKGTAEATAFAEAVAAAGLQKVGRQMNNGTACKHC
jgi:hypothetical protein